MWVTGPPGQSLTLKTSPWHSVPTDPTQTAHAEAAGGLTDVEWSGAELAAGGVWLTSGGLPCHRDIPASSGAADRRVRRGCLRATGVGIGARRAYQHTPDGTHTRSGREAIRARFAVSNSGCCCRSVVTLWIVVVFGGGGGDGISHSNVVPPTPFPLSY